MVKVTGQGITQEQAITEVLAFPKEDPRRNRILQLLVSWKITLEIDDPAEDTERGVLMVLSQAYLEWEKTTEARGIQQGMQEGIQQGMQEGIQIERRLTLETLFQARFGVVDESLMAILPVLVALPMEEYKQLLLELPRLSQNDLLARFERRS